MPLPPMPSTSTLSISSPGAGPPPLRRQAGLGHLLGERPGHPEHVEAVEHVVGSTPTVRPRTWALMPSASALASSRSCSAVVDRLGLVDQHDRDVLADGVAPLQAGVVERVLVGEVEQRALVLGAGEDLEELGVECHGSALVGDEGPHLGDVGVARGAGGGFEVEPQQRLGVGRAEVEPPVAEVDGETVDAVLGGTRRRPPATRSMTPAGSSTVVLISPEAA